MLSYQLHEILEGGNISHEEDWGFTGKIYFLTKGDDVIYVGQSSNLKNRLGGHRDKDYDGISFISVPEHAMNDVEAHYIVKFNPELNNALPSSNLYVSKGNVRSQMIAIIDELVSGAIDEIEISYETKKSRNPKYKQKQYIKSSDCKSIVSKFKKSVKNFIKEGETK